MTTTTHTHQRRVLPGMLCKSIEFFTNSGDVNVIMNGGVLSFNELPTPIYQLLKEEMLRNTDAYEILKEWHPESEMRQLETFAHCRYGDLDNDGDLKDMVFNTPEFWDCPLRGSCKGEGIVCALPNYKGNPLCGKEVTLLRCITTSMTNEAIADALAVPLGTFHNLKQKLYVKLGDIQTKQEATIIALELNLI